MTVDKATMLENGYSFKLKSSVRKPGLYLILNFMFGDADGKGKEEFRVENLGVLQALEKYFKFLDSLGWNAEIKHRGSGYSVREAKFYEVVGIHHKEDYLFNQLNDAWLWDIRYDNPGKLESYTLIYSDGNTEYDVTKVGGVE